jgi:hypothetical protein
MGAAEPPCPSPMTYSFFASVRLCFVSPVVVGMDSVPPLFDRLRGSTYRCLFALYIPVHAPFHRQPYCFLFAVHSVVRRCKSWPRGRAGRGWGLGLCAQAQAAVPLNVPLSVAVCTAQIRHFWEVLRGIPNLAWHGKGCWCPPAAPNTRMLHPASPQLLSAGREGLIGYYGCREASTQ